MGDDIAKSIGPAYVPYKTFSNFIGHLREHGVPSQIDRTVVPNLSGSAQAMLFSSLRFLKLMDEQFRPTSRLHELVDAQGDQQRELLKDIVENAYSFLAKNSIDIKKATLKQIEEEFSEAGLGGSTIDKAVAFFLTAAKEAGIDLSSHLKPKRFRSSEGQASRRNPKRKVRAVQSADESDERRGGALPPGTEKFEIPLPGKPNASIVLPQNLSPEDWTMLKGILELYAKRLIEANE